MDIVFTCFTVCACEPFETYARVAVDFIFASSIIQANVVYTFINIWNGKNITGIAFKSLNFGAHILSSYKVANIEHCLYTS